MAMGSKNAAHGLTRPEKIAAAARGGLPSSHSVPDLIPHISPFPTRASYGGKAHGG
jgi:hypothetical protein